MRLTHPNVDPTPISRESAITLPAGDRFVAIRRSFLQICKGDHCAAALANELRLIYDARLSAGEDQWFQRKFSYWQAALLGLYGDKKIRAAFELLQERGIIDVKTAEGDQSGGWFRLNPDRLQSLLNRIGTDPIRVEPRQKGRPPRQKGRGPIYNARAVEPSPELSLQEQQQTDLGVTYNEVAA